MARSIDRNIIQMIHDNNLLDLQELFILHGIDSLQCIKTTLGASAFITAAAHCRTEILAILCYHSAIDVNICEEVSLLCLLVVAVD